MSATVDPDSPALSTVSTAFSTEGSNGCSFHSSTWCARAAVGAMYARPEGNSDARARPAETGSAVGIYPTDLIAAKLREAASSKNATRPLKNLPSIFRASSSSRIHMMLG